MNFSPSRIISPSVLPIKGIQLQFFFSGSLQLENVGYTWLSFGPPQLLGNGIEDLKVSGDGRTLVVKSWQSLRIIGLERLDLRWIIPGLFRDFDIAGNLLAATDGSEVMVWDIEDGSERYRERFDIWPLCLKFSPSGEMLAIGDYSGNVILIEMRSFEKAGILKGNGYAVCKLAFSRGKKKNLLAVIDEGSTYKIWNFRTGHLMDEIPAYSNDYTFSLFGDTPKRICENSVEMVGSSLLIQQRSAITILDLQKRKAYSIKTLTIESIAISDDGHWLYAIVKKSNDFFEQFFIEIWNLWSKKLEHKDQIDLAFASSPRLAYIEKDSSLLYSQKSKLFLLKDRKAKLLYEMTYRRNVFSLSSDEKYLLMSIKEHEIEIWNIETAQMVWSSTLDQKINDLKFSTDGKYFAICTSSEVEIWKFTSFKRLAKRKLIEKDMDWKQVLFSPKKQIVALIAQGKDSEYLEIWNWKSDQVSDRIYFETEDSSSFSCFHKDVTLKWYFSHKSIEKRFGEEDPGYDGFSADGNLLLLRKGLFDYLALDLVNKEIIDDYSLEHDDSSSNVKILDLGDILLAAIPKEKASHEGQADRRLLC